MNAKKLLSIFLTIIIISISLIQFPLLTPKAEAIPSLNAINYAISKGKTYLDRFYVDNFPSSGYAVMRDLPSLPFNIYSSYANQFRFAGTEYVQSELVSVGNGLQNSPLIFRYKFEDGSDNDFNDLIIKVYYMVGDSLGSMRVIVEKESSDAAFPINLYIGDTLIASNIQAQPDGTTWVVERNRGWESARYIARHATRIAAWLYEDFGDTAKANKLHAFMNYYGYSKDVYAPLWGKSNSYNDEYDLWSTASFPDPSTYANLPWRTTDYGEIPYKSRLALAPARDTYLHLNREDEDGMVRPALGDLILAIHYMNKYGSSKLSIAKALIDRAGWDGNGFRKTAMAGGVIYSAPAYQTYATAVGLIAYIKYWYLSQDPNVVNTINQIASVLLQLQYRYGVTEIQDVGVSYYYDQEGGWLTSYDTGGSYIYKPWISPIIDVAYKILDSLGYYNQMPPEYPYLSITNTESTILALKALLEYKNWYINYYGYI
jgi:hypothetical protein